MRVLKRFLNLSVGIVLVLSLSMPLIAPIRVWAANETFSGSDDVVGTAGLPVAIDDFFVDGTGNDIVPVTLYAPSGEFEFGITTGITFTDEGGSTVSFTGLCSDNGATLQRFGQSLYKVG